jgi:NAD(P)-dependent dehydrogenase (short-subunit alcohol dehydrogenase family)
VARLEAKRALVTGASSGIGAETARLLAREGCDVALVARGDGVAVTAARVEGEGRRAVQLRADVSDREALAGAVGTAVDELGGIDLAVVAAAAGAYGRFAEIPPDDFDRCISVTLGGTVNTVREVLPHLERSGGTLIVLGSAADSIPLTTLSPYVTAKHGVDGFVRTLRAELGAAGSSIRVSTVRPGAVDSPFWRHLTGPAELTPPPLPPLVAYSARTVAEAVVACAIGPRRSVTVGGGTLLLQGLNVVARPVVEQVVGLAGRLARRQASVDDTPDALWSPSGDGTVDGGLGGRPSLLNVLRLRGDRPVSGD